MVSLDTAPQALWGRPVIVGGGVAGLMTALSLAQPCILLDPAPIGGEASSLWAQGGLAAAVGADDSAELHLADTIAAGAGLVEPEAAAAIIRDGRDTVEALERLGVRFDRAADGAFALGLEAAHCRRRILHVRDATGRAIVEALGAAAVKTPRIERLRARAVSLQTGPAGIEGVVLEQSGGLLFLPTSSVVIATGGIGGLWRSTTNPVAACGTGLVLAAKAGATLRDLEFVQFHPTALAVGADPMPLVSEAIRGEGAYLVNGRGERFMDSIPGRELAPRDVVARAVFAQWSRDGFAALDTRHWPAGRFAERFPTIHAVLAQNGLDPERDPIPIRPAAHYHMGGVAVNETGRTGIDGLWACGEVASTGLHGANRLASNSLLEAAVCGRIVARDLDGVPRPAVAAVGQPQAILPAAAGAPAALRDLMDRNVGVVRTREGLTRALAEIDAMSGREEFAAQGDLLSLARLLTNCALARTECRGAHWRSDLEVDPSPRPGGERSERVSAPGEGDAPARKSLGNGLAPHPAPSPSHRFAVGPSLSPEGRGVIMGAPGNPGIPRHSLVTWD